MNHNKTKKLTTGAMLLAIVGVAILLDRLTGFYFSEIVILILPVVIVMYSSMYEFKDGWIMSFCLAIIGFLLGNLYGYYIYLPVAVLVGMGYSFGVKKNMDRRMLCFISMILFVLGEIFVFFVVSPILGISIQSQIDAIDEMLRDMQSMEIYFSILGDNIGKLLIISFVFSIILTGMMEGLIIHLLVVFLLRRFKIKNLGIINIYEQKANPITAYVCMLGVMMGFLSNTISNEYFTYFATSVALVGAMVLMYYGYIFVLLYSRMVLRKNIVVFLIIFILLFFSAAVLLLLILGFLYAAGPLRNVLEERVREIYQRKE